MPSKILFYFQGGGSCWDEESTKLSGYEVKNTRCRTDAIPWPVYGVFERSDPRNPYNNYTIINVLYCSGDNHLGDVIRNYTDEEGIPIQQVGVQNVLSVLSWVKQQQELRLISRKLDDLVIMGCSAGSIASQIWANEIIKELNYPRHSSVILDSYIGLFPEEVEGQLIYEFGICNLYFLPSKLKNLCAKQQISMFDFIYSQIRAIPHVPFLFIHPSADRVQIKYYNYVADSYSQPKLDTESFISTSNKILLKYNDLDNFVVYYINSDQHCYTPTPYIYYTYIDGIQQYSNENNDDELNANDDNSREEELITNTGRESLNKWISRAPLQNPGEQITSECSDDLCNSNYNNSELTTKTFIMSSSSSKNLDYDPSSLVLFIDSFPHWNTNFQNQNNQNSTSYSLSDWNEYLQVMIPFPVLLHSIFLFLGLLVIFIVMMKELSSERMLYTNPIDPYHNNESEDDHEITLNKIHDNGTINSPNSSILSPQYLSSSNVFSPMRYYSYFYFFLILLFIFNFFYFIGYFYMKQGITSSINTIHTLEEAFTTLNYYLAVIIDKEHTIASIFSQTSCNGNDDLSYVLNTNEKDLLVYMDKIDSSLSYLQTTQEIMETYFLRSLTIFIFILFSLNFLLISSYFIIVLKRFSSLLVFIMVLTIFIFILSMIFSAIYLVLLVSTLFSLFFFSILTYHFSIDGNI